MWKLFLMKAAKEIFIRSNFIGIGMFGSATLIPNIMISDSGAQYGATIGACSSVSFMLSGLIGMLHCKFIPKIIAIYLIPVGFFLQISAFIVGFVFYK